MNEACHSTGKSPLCTADFKHRSGQLCPGLVIPAGFAPRFSGRCGWLAQCWEWSLVHWGSSIIPGKGFSGLSNLSWLKVQEFFLSTWTTVVVKKKCVAAAAPPPFKRTTVLCTPSTKSSPQLRSLEISSSCGWIFHDHGHPDYASLSDSGKKQLWQSWKQVASRRVGNVTYVGM